ncbi:probable RNA helicase armi isoform X2 [Bacillus rossius redtenbacheri]|uniref:probable RNA helicase armi isoform X2 n=1 Tax=Bacillus rossius redtenbacheri TaxID=93214 RepID=UPI002FDDAF24
MLSYIWCKLVGMVGYKTEDLAPKEENIDDVFKALTSNKYRVEDDSDKELNVGKAGEDQNSEDICEARTGVITMVKENHGLIDKTYLFDLDLFPLQRLCVGQSVKFLAYRKNKQSGWNVRKIFGIVHEMWDGEGNAGPETSNKNAGSAEKMQSMKTKLVRKVDQRDGRTLILVPGDIECNLDSVASEFTPVVGDWLQLEAVVAVDEDVADVSGEVLSIDSVTPLRSRVTEAAVTRLLEDGCGIINLEIFFSPDACEMGYKPCVGDRVACQAIESEQWNLIWRAIQVVCLFRADKTANVPRQREDENLPRNRNGIFVSPSDELVVLNMGEAREVTLSLENKGTGKQLLLRSFFASKRCDSQLCLKYPNCSKKFEINPGQEVKYVFLCKGMFIGESMEKFVFVFKDFSIGYKFRFEVKDKLIKALQDYHKPYRRRVDAKSLQRNSRRNMVDVIPGVRPCKPPAFLNVALGRFPVPDQLWNIVLGEEDSTGYMSDILKRLQHARPCLIADLCFENYSDRFHSLLYVEEIDATVKLRRFDMERANFQFAGPGGQYLSLEVPGLAEKRPSVIVGDCVHAENLTDDITEKVIHAGYVHQVYKQHVWLKFDSNFHSSYDMSDYRMSFQFNRTPVRRCHAAVNDAVAHLRAAVLFPTQVRPQLPQVILEPEDDLALPDGRPLMRPGTLSESDFKRRKLFWFNKSLNCYQKEAVRNILRGEARPLPYIIFGPPGTGKTITLVETVLQVLHLMPHSRLLIATPSNSSANLIAERLLDSNYLRPGDLIRLVGYHCLVDGTLPERLIPFSTSADISYYDEKSLPRQFGTLENELKLSSNARTVGRHRVTVSTCVTLGQLRTMGFKPGHFTHILVDEAGQATEPEILIPLGFLNTKDGQAVLAGDPLQLGPVVSSDLASHLGLGESLLSRLIHRFPYQRDPVGFPDSRGFDPRLVTKLVVNYRSLPDILRLPNSLFYHSELEAYVSPTDSPEAKFLAQLSSMLPRTEKGTLPMVFHGVKGTNRQDDDCPSWYNLQEVTQVLFYINKLYSLGTEPDDLGIITPYIRQVGSEDPSNDVGHEYSPTKSWNC